MKKGTYLKEGIFMKGGIYVCQERKPRVKPRVRISLTKNELIDMAIDAMSRNMKTWRSVVSEYIEESRAKGLMQMSTEEAFNFIEQHYGWINGKSSEKAFIRENMIKKSGFDGNIG